MVMVIPEKTNTASVFIFLRLRGVPGGPLGPLSVIFRCFCRGRTFDVFCAAFLTDSGSIRALFWKPFGFFGDMICDFLQKCFFAWNNKFYNEFPMLFSSEWGLRGLRPNVFVSLFVFVR